MIRTTIGLLFAVSPMPIKRMIAKYLFHWKLDPTARIGISLILTKNLIMGRNAYIGHGNVFRDLMTVTIADKAMIGQWNWFSAAPSLAGTSSVVKPHTLELGTQSAITSRHYVDCSGGVSIGAFSTLAGARSTILTHQIDLTENKQTTAPVCIGNYCFLSSDIRIVSGSSIPDKSVVAMGAVVAGKLSCPETLYAGVPARPMKRIDGAWFDRSEGFTL